MFKRRTRLYKKLLASIKACPDPEIGDWAVRTMAMLVKLKGSERAAVHFAELLMADTRDYVERQAAPPGIPDRCLAYLQHVIDDEGGRVG